MRTSTVWLKSIVMVVILAVCAFVLVPVGLAQRDEPKQEGGTASEAGLGVASFLLTLPYGATKLAFATSGGVIGGLAYVFSGFDEATAKTVWTTSVYGTYILTPDHLRGEKPVRFLGVEDESVNGQVDDSSR